MAMITGFSMGNLAMGVDLASLEQKFNFDKGKVVQQAIGRSDKKEASSDAK
jgi:hypothetical protein